MASLLIRYRRLEVGKTKMVGREIQRLHKIHSECAFCGRRMNGTGKTNLLPLSFKFKPKWQNFVYVCKKCSSDKGDTDFLEWWRFRKRRSMKSLPILPLALYLRNAYRLNKLNHTLNAECLKLEDILLPLTQARSKKPRSKIKRRPKRIGAVRKRVSRHFAKREKTRADTSTRREFVKENVSQDQQEVRFVRISRTLTEIRVYFSTQF